MDKEPLSNLRLSFLFCYNLLLTLIHLYTSNYSTIACIQVMLYEEPI